MSSTSAYMVWSVWGKEACINFLSSMDYLFMALICDLVPSIGAFMGTLLEKVVCCCI